MTGPVPAGAAAGALAVLAYLAVVVATTPALAPAEAVSAALQLNPVLISGMGAAVGAQAYVSSRARGLGCGIGGAGLGSSGGTAASSFFSFFSLVPLGCCGWWLYALSLLPGILGTGAAAALVDHGQAMAYAGLGAVSGLACLSAVRLRRALQVTKT